MLSSFKKPYKKKQQTKGPELDAILEDIAVIFHKSIEELKGRRKYERLVKCRKIYAFVAATITNAKPQIIAGVINRERTMVSHYKSLVQFNMKEKTSYWEEIWQKYTSESKIWKKYYLPDKKVA